MATVLFSTVGQALGGPLGAAVGAMAGGIVDRTLFGRRPGQPAEPLMMRSAYGEVVPRLFGTVRVAGLLIWAEPMRTAGRKGSGRRAGAMNLAIALSAGPVREVRRIWADGREIRSAEGLFAVPTVMRVHDGTGRGDPDPLIAAAEGPGRAPGYRGLAYVVFEGLALGDYGNRIPALSFEVVSEAGTASDWLRSLADAMPVEPGEGTATGYVAGAGRLGDDLAMLARVAGVEPAQPAGEPRWRGAAPALALPARKAGGQRRTAAGEQPSTFEIAYLDPARDYQAGRQMLLRNRSGPAAGLVAPLVATAEEAQAIAARLLRGAEASADTVEVQLAYAGLGLFPGDRVVFAPGSGAPEGPWRILAKDVTSEGVRLRLMRLAREGPAGGDGDPGRALAQPVRPAGPTRFDLFEPPIPPDGGAAALWVVASGGAGWRGADILELRAGELLPLGIADRPVPAGDLLAPLAPGPVGIWDERAGIELAVDGLADPLFESRSPADVLAGANLLLVGAELVQFREAAMLSAGRMRLRGLLRGCFGTAPAGAPAGARAVAVAATVRRPVAPDAVGAGLMLLAEGPGDPPGGTAAAWTVTGAGLAPLAPAHLRAWRAADGSLGVRWIARGWSALAWDGPEPDMPACLFRLRVAGTVRLERLSSTGAVTVTAAEQAALFGGPAPAGLIEVEALGPGPAEVRRTATVAI